MQTSPELKIKAAAIRLPDGRVFTGRMHGDIIQGFPGVVPQKTATQGVPGFVTTADDFVSRGMAREIAVAAKQVPTTVRELFSEDLMEHDSEYFNDKSGGQA